MFLEKINEDIKISMKNKESARVNSLRYVKSLLLENTKAVKQREEIEVLTSYKKTLEKSLETFKGHPSELDKINKDISILSSYLPKQMSEEEIISIIKEIKTSKNITEFNVMIKEAVTTLKGKADGKVISKIVKEIIN